jgi:alkylhydroperoxidase/carboxymuconolactone decarboxylase family protein YurZ
LEAARTDDALREVVASLWALAVSIEDGNVSDVDKALRAAQEALKQALERGASDEEIKKLTTICAPRWTISCASSPSSSATIRSSLPARSIPTPRC